MWTKYPYSALARNYIVQTSLTWRPLRSAMMSARENVLLDDRNTPFYRRTRIPLCYWSPTPVHRLAIGDSC